MCVNPLVRRPSIAQLRTLGNQMSEGPPLSWTLASAWSIVRPAKDVKSSARSSAAIVQPGLVRTGARNKDIGQFVAVQARQTQTTVDAYGSGKLGAGRYCCAERSTCLHPEHSRRINEWAATFSGNDDVGPIVAV